MIKKVESYPLYDDGDHKVFWLGIEEAEDEKGILTNQYLIIDNDEAVLIDPGGYFVFERVLKNVSSKISPTKIKYLLYSHQDPDVIAGMNLWFEYAPLAKIVISKLWIRFIPHLAVLSGSRTIGIPDEGMDISVGNSKIKALPAHYLHSPGNFVFYDTKAKILFSSDIGAAAFPEGEWYLFVEDFEKHTKYMEAFHKRYMSSSKALRAWVRTVKNIDINMIAPQHGAILEGKNIEKFLNWLYNLEVGIDVYEHLFKI
ncbi:MAG TPA: MBL fold metallo-hydrolase [Thermococcus paralvinellae]|uniref:MBL fold metallo-hydrolase n=1 Tax=Thermococcus paralvinellae TaxID=582419 RepID=A0A833E0W3_9EURY|nr:MBL fold metallo-hydrolase [Thermococcus paralvinellae]